MMYLSMYQIFNTILTHCFDILCIFASVYRADHQRISYIRDKVSAGEKKIEILHLPYESYIWTPTPNKGEIWEERYKLFYDIPQNVTLNSVWVYSK